LLVVQALRAFLIPKCWRRASMPSSPSTPARLHRVARTALAALRLERDGRLALDDDIRRHLPELPDYRARVTVRDLLQHTSGLRGYPALEQLTRRPVQTMADLLALQARQRSLNFQPGTLHEYSHSDYELLGLLIERVVGEPFGAFLEREVLQPLGMRNSRVHDRRRVSIPNRALAYRSSGQGYAVTFPESELVGGTGLYTTVEDLLHWDRNFYDGDLGGRDLIDRLHERPTLVSGDAIPYAFGLQHGEYRGLPIVHRGGGGGFATELLRFPEQRFAVATLCNAGAAHPLYLSRAVADVYLDAVMEPPAKDADIPQNPVAAPADELARYTGVYRPIDVPWNFVTLANRDGRLWEVFPDTSIALARLPDGRYFADGLFYTFVQPTPGSSLRLELSAEAESLLEALEKMSQSEQWRPGAAALDDYAGRFYSEDLDTTWELVRIGNALVLRGPAAVDQPLTPVSRDVFMRMLGTYDRPLYIRIQFERDTRGAVTRFDVATPPGIDAVRRLRFERLRLTG
jgi:CubicO group peptidase (beta-lactamase class C family)